MKKLTQEFYGRPTLEVATDLLGKIMVRQTVKGRLSGKIVETEAYIGAIDKAAHCYRNKITERTKIMFGPGGYAYVYLIYGMYYCFNVVTETEGQGAAVLIRAIEPVEGLEIMAQNRGQRALEELTARQRLNLSNGPGKLCQALGITKAQNKLDLCGEEVFLLEEEKREIYEVVAGPRINIDYAEEAIHFPWRFYIKGNPYVSRK